MNKLNKDVTHFLIKLNHPFFEEINELRKIILGSEKEIIENIKWNGPNYSFKNQDFLTLKIHPPKNIQLIFHRGAKKLKQPETKFIEDTSNLLVWKENDRAIVTFNSLIEIQLQKSVICENVSNWIQNL